MGQHIIAFVEIKSRNHITGPPHADLAAKVVAAALTGPRWGLALRRKGGGGTEPSAVSPHQS